MAAITPSPHRSSRSRAGMEGLVAERAIEEYVLTLRGVLIFAVRRGLIARQPVRAADTRQTAQRRERHGARLERRRARGPDRGRRALARQPEGRYDYAPLIRAAMYTGLRLGELLGLQWQDVDIHDGVLHVQRQWPRTGQHARPKTKAGAPSPAPALSGDDEVPRPRSSSSQGTRAKTDPVFA